MSEFLLHYYPVHPTTWVYVSSLMMVSLFFKFGRFWSVRNLDLLLLVLLAPGLLLVHFGEETTREEMALASIAKANAAEAGLTDADDAEADAARALADDELPVVATEVAPPLLDEESTLAAGDAADPPAQVAPTATVAAVSEPSEDQPREPRGYSLQRIGYVWLLSVCGLFLIRLLLDPTMVRRPLLDPNLSPGGLTFTGCSLFVFLMANVISSPVTEDDLAGPRGAEQLMAGVAEDPEDGEARQRYGPGNALLHAVPSLATTPLTWAGDGAAGNAVRYVRTAKFMAVLSHLAVVFGIVAIGYRHFENIRMGIGAATLYLMLPYTAQMTGRVDHVLPAALLVWAVLCYRRPLPAGMFIGLAIGVQYYPLFLLPLWISFYWQRGLMRFLGGVLTTLTASVLSLVLVSASFADFLTKVQQLFGIWLPKMDGLQGIWGLGWDEIYRIPVLAGFFALSGAMAIWPAQKNLGTLLSCSAAVMVATQFWHGYGGGLYMAWFLPLVLLTIFRPNLEDRVALSVLGEGWFPRRRRANLDRIDRAA